MIKKNKTNGIITHLSHLSFGIYLIHGIILNVIMKYIPYNNITSFVGIPILLIILAISSLIVTLIKKNKFISDYL